jgi:hypothetical protein
MGGGVSGMTVPTIVHFGGDEYGVLVGGGRTLRVSKSKAVRLARRHATRIQEASEVLLGVDAVDSEGGEE